MRIQFLPDGSLFVLILQIKLLLKKKKREKEKSEYEAIPEMSPFLKLSKINRLPS